MQCSNCGFENNNTNKFCVKCGTELSVIKEKPKIKKSNGINKKTIIIISTIVLVAIVICTIFAALHFNKSKPSTIEAPFIYETENELFYCKDTKDGVESVCVSDDFAGIYQLSNDNKYIIYIEGERKGNNTLYALEWSNEKAEKIMIGKNVDSIEYVFGSAEKIYYTNDINEEEQELICTDLNGNSQSIMKIEDNYNLPWASEGNAKNLIFVSVNENEKQSIIAVNTESNSHYTISSNCDDEYNCSFPGNKWSFNYADYDNASKIYFIEENKLYSSDMFGNRELVSSDVRDVCVNGTDVYYQTIDNVFEDVYSDSYLYGEYDDYDSDDDQTYLSTGSVYYYDELTGSNLRLLSNVTAEEIDYDICTGKDQKINKVVYLRNCIDYNVYDFNFDYELPYSNFVTDEGISFIDFNEEYYVLTGKNAVKIKTGYTIDDIEACPEQEGCLITCIPNEISKYDEEYFDNVKIIYYLPENASSFDDAQMAAQNVFGYAYTESVEGNEIIFKDYDRKDETVTMIIGKDIINNVILYGIKSDGSCGVLSEGNDIYYYVKNGETFEFYSYSNGNPQKLRETEPFIDELGMGIYNGKFYAITGYSKGNEDYTYEITCFDGDKKYIIATDVLEISDIDSSSSFYAIFY